MLLVTAILSLFPATARAQLWNDAETMSLVRRAIQRRIEVRADTSLRDYYTRAHGFVFFLAQLGDLAEQPRLVKSDQLELEVYWKAPGRTKQLIIGWRDRADLPTDIRYHRDHLGIVTNNFGDRIGIGEGDEISDVPHPLAADGPDNYDFALVDSQTVRLQQRSIRVYEVSTRPKDFDAARVVGTLYIDVAEAELVRFRFNFTRNAYIDETLDDITVVLENALWDGRYWLPSRQELEIRRHSSWLDLPARGIIRGWWEIDSYRFNTGISDAIFRGQPIVAAPQAVRDTFAWDGTLDAAIRAISEPGMTFDLETVRAEVLELAESQVVKGFTRAQPGARSISDLLHFNRVEGLAPGIGGVFRPGGGASEIRLWGSYGIDDQRVKGRITLKRSFDGVTVEIECGRSVRDIAEYRVIAPVINSMLAQEFGNDYGDYYLATEGTISARFQRDARASVTAALGFNDTESLATVAKPASGTFRANHALGAGRSVFGRLNIERMSSGFSSGRGFGGSLNLEAGKLTNGEYLRLFASGRAQLPVIGRDLVARAWIGWGSETMPAYRAFSVGGRGSLVGQPFRAWGGRRVAYGSVEWRLPLPFFAIPLGARVSTGNRVFLVPFAAAGWSGGLLHDGVGVPSDGVRPVVGLGIEWFHSLLRADFAMSLRTRVFGITLDVSRDLWPIL